VLRHPGDLEWLERRRLQAADLFAQGKTTAEVAGWVCRRRPRAAGTPAGATAGWRGWGTARQGKPVQLRPAELAKITRVLDRGSVAARATNDL
jgi:hypothetical protein